MTGVSAKSSVVFPDPSDATEDGLLCIGGDLRVPTLLAAYERGIFPWPQEGYPLLWFSPPERGVLDFDEAHFSKSFLRELKKSDIEISFDRDFKQVIQECASVPRAHESGTWILPEMLKAYVRFHEAGYAHSVEAWRDGVLIGGVYGVYVKGVFSGESMFYKESNASKLCLWHLLERLKEMGLKWMDTQMVTPLVKSLGGKSISRDEFLTRLSESHMKPASAWEVRGKK